VVGSAVVAFERVAVVPVPVVSPPVLVAAVAGSVRVPCTLSVRLETVPDALSLALEAVSEAFCASVEPAPDPHPARSATIARARVNRARAERLEEINRLHDPGTRPVVHRPNRMTESPRRAAICLSPVSGDGPALAWSTLA
jgi:hypothetical protein